MSQIIWSKKVCPESDSSIRSLSYDIYDKGLSIENTRIIEKADKEIVALPDRKAYRSMSRSSVILSATALESKEILASYLEDDPFSVGIYCAINHGPEDYQCAKELLDIDREEFANLYKKNRSPKHYLKQLPNLAPAQLGIFLGVMGPINTYTHGSEGAYQAMEQAEFDLNNNIIKAALVCSAFSLDDPLLAKKTRAEVQPTLILSEGGAALVITKSENKDLLSKKLNTYRNKSTGDHFGIADPLITLLMNCKEL
ncbi:MAG: hypothetical protein R3B45_03180 [Bdellovibrionota bacterium]